MKYILLAVLTIFASLPLTSSAAGHTMPKEVILQNTSDSQLWYINPATNMRHNITTPEQIFTIMSSQSLGVANDHLMKIPVGDANLGGPDRDGDGLSDAAESSFGTDPNSPDTDNDGYDDRTEILSHNNPLTSESLSIDSDLIHRLEGRLLIQPESHGEVWYVNPKDDKRYFLGKSQQALSLFTQIAIPTDASTVTKYERSSTIAATAQAAGSFETLVNLLGTADLIDTINGEGPFTVFAPTDDAFAQVPQETLDMLLADTTMLQQVLLYHVVPGNYPADRVLNSPSLTSAQGESITVDSTQNAKVNQANIISTNIYTDNGVIHVIDQVLLPPSLTEDNTMNIIDTARSAGNFSTLLTALEAAGLTNTLANNGPFTVLAPTDEAFAKVPTETLEALLADQEALTQVLTYHVIEGSVPSTDVVNLSSATTLQGTNVNISAGDTVMINDATVVATDITADNGIIHVIDSVLLPN